MAAISGHEVLDEDFNKGRIKIAFYPFVADDPSKQFAVQDASHLKDKKCIPDISEIFKADFDAFDFSVRYCDDNPQIRPNEVNKVLTKLRGIANRQTGVIEPDHSLDIDEVTEIFIRINSKGTSLSQSDFVMSKMAADTVHGGNILRKVVDYFCHLAVKPDFFPKLLKDTEFMETPYAQKIKWLSHDYDDIYDPDYGDMLRAAFMYSFNRGKLADLVSLLSGRDFETREFREEIVEQSYMTLNDGILKFINEYNFKQFVLAIKGAGYISSKLLNSQMTLDFAYMLFLRLMNDEYILQAQEKRYLQKWFVLSALTGRYVGSPETVMSRDIRNIIDKGFISYFQEIEASVLPDTFWSVTLPQNLETTSVNSPAFSAFLAAQIFLRSNSFLQRGTTVADLINISGDVHHIFPKAYLKKNGVDSKSKYNQVANYIYLDTQVNKAVGEDAPNIYLGKVEAQCASKEFEIGNIFTIDDLRQNLDENAIPEEVMGMTVDDYDTFLRKRRLLMGRMIERFYKSL